MPDSNPGRLVDGSEPMRPEALLARLEARGIRHSNCHHEAMRTVEDAKAIRAPSPYGHTKNLFLRNKKGRMWLLTLHEDCQLDLKATAEMLGTNRLGFASVERMMLYLGITPGAVSPFALVNDVTRQVTFYIDATLMEHPYLNLHPLVNTQTTTLDREDLLKFLADDGHPHSVLPTDRL